MADTGDNGSHVRIDPGTAIGVVSLIVSDLARSQQFYEQLLGLRSVPSTLGPMTVSLANAGGDVLVELLGSSQAPPRDPHKTGLFHLAVLYPTRRDLAVALMRMAAAHWPISGASDHLVSEAIYLHDPDGNGIEIYADRQRATWPFTANGEVEMDTLPLDVDDLVAELEAEPPQVAGRDLHVPAGTKIGHVHLQVSDLNDVEAFYVGVLGFDVMARWRGQALFVSAGGYHHHIGLNTWNSRGASAPPEGSVGLVSFEVVLPNLHALDDVSKRLSEAGIAFTDAAGGAVRVSDPSGNNVTLRPAS